MSKCYNQILTQNTIIQKKYIKNETQMYKDIKYIFPVEFETELRLGTYYLQFQILQEILYIYFL